MRARSRRQREYFDFKMKGEKNACVKSICAETNCTTILNEKGGPSICCDVCEDLFCTKCIGITKRNYAKVEELESKFDSIKSIGDIIAKDLNETMTYSKVLKKVWRNIKPMKLINQLLTTPCVMAQL